jgi:hypothetical protein
VSSVVHQARALVPGRICGGGGRLEDWNVRAGGCSDSPCDEADLVVLELRYNERNERVFKVIETRKS